MTFSNATFNLAFINLANTFAAGAFTTYWWMGGHVFALVCGLVLAGVAAWFQRYIVRLLFDALRLTGRKPPEPVKTAEVLAQDNAEGGPRVAVHLMDTLMAVKGQDERDILWIAFNAMYLKQARGD